VQDNGDEIARIIDRVCHVAGIKTVAVDQDIYDAGMSSLHALSLLLELEDTFAVAIPDTEFVKARTPRALLGVIASARGEAK
jgi:acyl carrier protein